MSENKTRWISAGILVVCVLALVVGIVTALQGTGDGQAIATEDKKDKSRLIEAISGIKGGDSLLMIHLSGPIVMQSQDSGLFGNAESNAIQARKALEAALKDDSVKGVLLAINSPGGTVGMSQELHAAVQRLEKKKPVLAYFGDVAASGGYYTAVAATKIMSNPGTLTGSIGVIISTLNFQELMEQKLGVRSYTFKSGKFKDLLNPYRKPGEAEKQLVQGMIDTSYQQFLNAVLEGRTKYVDDPEEKARLKEQIKSVADGRVLVGTEAKEMGLVDEIGDIHIAYEQLNQMAHERFKIKKEGKLPLEEYDDTPTLMEILGLSAQMPAVQVKEPFGVSKMMPLSVKYPNQPLWVME